MLFSLLSLLLLTGHCMDDPSDTVELLDVNYITIDIPPDEKPEAAVVVADGETPALAAFKATMMKDLTEGMTAVVNDLQRVTKALGFPKEKLCEILKCGKCDGGADANDEEEGNQ